MSEDTMKITAESGIPFTVRIVRQGDNYGRDMILIHKDDEPMVEFYDARFDNEYFTPGFGQFVTRYNASTLLGDHDPSTARHPGRGLCLDGGVPHWSIDGESLDRVLAWVKERLEIPSPGFRP